MRCRRDLAKWASLLLLLLNEPGGSVVGLRVIMLVGVDIRVGVIRLGCGTAR